MTRVRGRRIDDAALIEPGRGLTLRTGASRIRLVDRRVLALGRGEGAVIAGLAALGSAVSALFVVQGVLVARTLALVFAGSELSLVVPWLAASVAVLAVRYGELIAGDGPFARLVQPTLQHEGDVIP